MADKRVQDLARIESLADDDILVAGDASNGYNAYGVKGSVIATFARESAQASVDTAVQAAKDAETAKAAAQASAEAAADSAESSSTSAQNAAQSADKAQQYSGKPPVIIDDYWWVWNADTGMYENTGESSLGNVMFASFEINPVDGILRMTTPEQYDGAMFALVNGYLEVTV